MYVNKIKNCSDVSLLEELQSQVFRDCADINNCDKCFHNNENDLCDLELCTRRISELIGGRYEYMDKNRR